MGWSRDSSEVDFDEAVSELAHALQDQDDAPDRQQTSNETNAELGAHCFSSPTLSRPTSPSSTASSSESEERYDANMPGAPIASCVPALERLHRKKIVLGEAPAAPFADFLEFEFVKWISAKSS